LNIKVLNPWVRPTNELNPLARLRGIKINKFFQKNKNPPSPLKKIKKSNNITV